MSVGKLPIEISYKKERREVDKFICISSSKNPKILIYRRKKNKNYKFQMHK